MMSLSAYASDQSGYDDRQGDEDIEKNISQDAFRDDLRRDMAHVGMTRLPYDCGIDDGPRLRVNRKAWEKGHQNEPVHPVPTNGRYTLQMERDWNSNATDLHVQIDMRDPAMFMANDDSEQLSQIS